MNNNSFEETMNTDKPFRPLTTPHEQFSGTFVTRLDGVGYELTLHPSGKGLRGSLNLDGLTFDLKGQVSKEARFAYGVLLESMTALPVALFCLRPRGEGLWLELDAPDFEEGN